MLHLAYKSGAGSANTLATQACTQGWTNRFRCLGIAAKHDSLASSPWPHE